MEEVEYNANYFKERIPFLKTFHENKTLGKEEEVHLYKIENQKEHEISFKNGTSIILPLAYISSDFLFFREPDDVDGYFGYTISISNKFNFHIPDKMSGEEYRTLSKLRTRVFNKYSRTFFCKETAGRPDSQDRTRSSVQRCWRQRELGCQQTLAACVLWETANFGNRYFNLKELASGKLILKHSFLFMYTKLY
jgi:hypothetical protein